MQLDDLKQGWNEAVTSQTSTDDLTEIITKLEKQTTKMDKEIIRRVVLEISIAILLIPFWIYGLFNTVGTMQTMGFITAIMSCIYIPYKLLKAKKVTAVKSSSIKDFLIREKQKLQQQKQLLESIVWWYIAPLTLSIILITLGATATDSSMFHINDFLQRYYFFLTLLVVGVYFLNKRAAKKKFVPLLENIEQRLIELDN